MLFILLNTTQCASFHTPCNYSKPLITTLVNDCGNILKVDLNATDQDLFDTLLDHQSLNQTQLKYFDLDRCKYIYEHNGLYAEYNFISSQIGNLISDQEKVYENIFDLNQHAHVYNFIAYKNTLEQFEKQLQSLGIFACHCDSVYEQIEDKYQNKNMSNPLIQLFFKLGKYYVNWADDKELREFVEHYNHFYELQKNINKELTK